MSWDFGFSPAPVVFRGVIVGHLLFVFPTNVSKKLEPESKEFCNGGSARSSAIRSRSRRSISMILREMGITETVPEYGRK